MNKHGFTDYYFDLGIYCFGYPPSSSLLTYRDDLVFITEYNQLSYVDVSKLAFTPFNKESPFPKLEKNKLFSTLPNGRAANGLIVIANT